MYLTLISIVKSIFSSSHSKGVVAPASEENEDHVYIKGNPDDRGPCPGLNALANQGYLPRDGKNLTLAQVETALKNGLHMTPLLATSLTNALKPLLRKDKTFDLADTRRHNVIEHDNSFTRHDLWQGDNYTFQPDMLAAILDDADGGPITLKSLAKSFKRRDREQKAIGAPKLPLKLWFVRVLNIAGSINTAALPKGRVPREVFEQLFAEERWAGVILENQKTRSVATLLYNAVVLVWYVVTGP
ncbi:Cloroperoxidase [Mollisia scopiformis]|uniref:Cloroperoxidase n=1 Tax=Mollisia scopiformis TaxID=149040 RepID=A0A194XX86_MOLSC|nr:Cloroperoxidase [Mollisia scopiformis]KUJ24407.1 Cloroperoxidase [Mollisia scopiformis]